MTDLTRIAIVGWEEGAAGLVQSWAAEIGYAVDCFVHPDDTAPVVDRAAALQGRDASQFATPENGSFKQRPLIAAADWPAALRARGLHHALVAISDNAQRLAEMAKAAAAGIELISALHPSVLVLPDAIIGRNVIAHARAVIGYRAEIGDGVILNTGAQVDHHCVLRAGCSLGPAAVLAGNITVGARAQIHTGAVVKNRQRIGADAVIGAGAVVIRDMPEAVTVVGVPAKPLNRT